MTQTARHQELRARYFLAHQEEIPVLLKQKRWAELAAVAEYAANDAPADLAQTDPALYRQLRQQITEYRIRGWNQLNVEKLKKLAGKSAR